MQKSKTCKECYDSCLANGMFAKKESVNIQRIKSLIENADTSISQADLLSTVIKKEGREWMGVYTNYYDALRIYTEALLLFEKTTIANHQCLFAYICQNYPALNLSWDFLEEIRKKRNGVNYYGEHVTYDDWKRVEAKVKLHISFLKQELSKKLRLFEIK
jgi:hypothetical protein